MLLSNVIVKKIEAGVIEIAPVNPKASMQTVENEKLHVSANDLAPMLKNVIEKI